jgi:gliding motility-associated-like protein
MGNWITSGVNNDWAWGTPVKPIITGAGAGTKCWITGGPVASFYDLGERSWVQSPCFDFTNVRKPYVSFLIFWETERTYDGGNFQYSTDGINWTTLGIVNETDTCSTQNWYNASYINNLTALSPVSHGWSGTIQPAGGGCSGGGGSGAWKRATHCMEFLAGKPLVYFRFTFGSGTTCNDFDGLAFDDIYIGESPSIPVDIKMTCLGPDRIQFEDLYKNCHATWNWDFGDPNSSTNTSTKPVSEHTFSQQGSFTISLSVTGGCSVDTTITKPLRLMSFTTQSTDVSCTDLSDGSAQISILNGNPPYTYDWSHDPTLNQSTATSLNAGHYSVVAHDSFCSVQADFDIGLGPLSNPVVDLGEDTVICPGTFIHLKAGSFTSYQWQDNSNDSVYIVSTNGIYSVLVRNSAGCSTSDSIFIQEDCLNDIVLPNAFTPNGDGINEKFFVDGSYTNDFEIFIFDRWGQLIFNSTDREAGWDGKVKDHPVHEGIYNYLVNYSIGKEERVKTGSVTVIR